MVARECIRQRCFAFEKIESALQERLEETHKMAEKKICLRMVKLGFQTRPVGLDRMSCLPHS